jgi:two-component sensor histidine kinase
MGSDAKNEVRDYALAILILAGAIVGRVALDRVLPGRLPFITFFPGVVLAAYLCGPAKSLTVLLLSALVGAYWVDPAPHENVTLFRVLSATFFLLFGGLMLYLIEQLKTAKQFSQRHEQQLELINRELKHRIKNLFTIATSICQQTIKSGGTPDAMAKSVAGRIHAISAAQDLLSATSSAGADVHSLVETLVTPMAPYPDSLLRAGPSVVLPAEATTPFALVLHELATNALKYGAWSGDGRVEATWHLEDRALKFQWRELGGPAVAPPVRQGLGSALINGGLPTANVVHDFLPEGLECRITLPLF